MLFVSPSSYLCCKYCENELAGVEGVEDVGHDAEVGRGGDVGLEAEIGDSCDSLNDSLVTAYLT